jgi:hypothetical protein
VTTSGAQMYDGAVTITAPLVELTTTNNPVQFGSTVDSEMGETNDLTLSTSAENWM